MHRFRVNLKVYLADGSQCDMREREGAKVTPNFFFNLSNG